MDHGLQFERNLFMDLCGGDEAMARMRAYENKRVTDSAQGLVAPVIENDGNF